MLKFPKELITEKFKNYSGFKIYQDSCKLIYTNLNNLECENLVNTPQIEILDINREDLVIKIAFTKVYMNYVFEYLNNEPKNILLADIGSWNPYAVPTDGQFLMTCHVDKIIKLKSLIHGSNPVRIFCVNNYTPRLFNEIENIQRDTTKQDHPKFLVAFIKNPHLSLEYKVNLLCNYYIKKFKEMGSRVGIYWNYWIYQSTCKEIFTDKKLESIKQIKKYLKKGIDRNGDGVLQVEHNNKIIVIYNLKTETMSYAGNDLVNMIRLFEKYKQDKIYLCVSTDHKYYTNCIETLSSFLDFIGVEHTKYILIYHAKAGYYDKQGNLCLYSKSKGNLGDSENLAFLKNITWINHFSYFFNTQKETFALDPEQQHGVVLNKTRALHNLLQGNISGGASDIGPFIYCLDKLHKIYEFNQLNLFDEIFRLGIKTQNTNVIKLINLIYTAINK